MKRHHLVIVLAISLSLPFANAADKKASTPKKAAASETKHEAKHSETALKVVKLDGAEGKDMVEVAVSSPDHTTLVVAVKAADLVETLTGPGPYTLFAPTNAAFAKLPKGTVENLLKPENKATLRSILEHHAAAPAYPPKVLNGMSDMDMVDGPKVKIEIKDGILFADGVEVKAAIQSKNGIIYIVDSILLAK